MEDFGDEGRFERARELLDNEQDLEAEEAFSELIARRPDWEGAYGNRGLARMHLGRDEEALSDFARVTELDSDDAMAFARKAEALRNLGRYPEALENIGKALELDPDDPDAHYLRGWLFFYCQQYDSAVEDLEHFIREAEDYGEVEDMLALCRTLAAADGPRGEAAEGLLRENGFSLDARENPKYVEEGLFCPYAHCVRLFPARGMQAADACAVTGFACPGGAKQADGCEYAADEDATGL